MHLRLPTSFCSPNFAYLMVSDAQDALRRVRGIGQVTVLLDDHHDSDKINAGIAANAGYLGTFGDEAHESLDALRLTFQRKAHTAAMERCVMAALTAGSVAGRRPRRLTLGDLPGGPDQGGAAAPPGRHRPGVAPGQPVVVDEHGGAVPEEELPLRLRLATVGAHLHRGQRPLLPGPARHPLRRRRRAGITTQITDTTSTDTSTTDTSTSHPLTARRPTLDQKD